MNPEVREAFNFLILTAFVVGLVLSLVRLVLRKLGYHVAGHRTPDLLNRDLILVAGLAVPFVIILGARVINFSLKEHDLWIMLSGVSAVLGVWVFTYYEYFRVERSK